MALRATVQAEVVGVSDGDTFTALLEGQQVKVRIHGIDAPENGQAFGNTAKKALSGLIFGRAAAITVVDYDRWGRAVASVESGGNNVGVSMVKAGMAWHFLRYASRDTALAAAEVSARKARRGLWSEARPVPPWDFRRVKDGG